jgi:hypothetical protein
MTEQFTADDWADVIANFYKTAIRPLVARITHLEAKLRELEQKASAGCEWKGVYQSDVTYASGSLTTKSGSLWLATRATAAVPGTDESWRLIVKSGSYSGIRGAA